MERDLREYFAAVGDEPGVVPGEMARVAIAEGGRLRRRRRRLAVAGVAGGVVLVMGAFAGLGVRGREAEPPVTVAAAMMPVTAPSCVERPAGSDATDAVVFLVGSRTAGQFAAIEAALGADARVAAVSFEGREQAYERFRALWAREPDLVAAVSAGQFPESFRVRLVAAGQYAAFRETYAAMGGVETISGRRCPAGAPVGGVL